MLHYNGSCRKMLGNWQLNDNPFWLDYQDLGPMFGLLKLLIGIGDVLPIIVGPKGCDVHSRFTLLPWGVDLELGQKPLLALDLDESSLIAGEINPDNGWFESLESIMKEVQPNLVVLIGTDALSVINADLAPVAAAVQSRTGTRTIHLMCGNGKGRNPLYGYNLGLGTLFSLSDARASGLPREGVNLVGWPWPTRAADRDIGQIISLLSDVGIPLVSVIPGGSRLEDIKRSLTTKANVLYCSAYDCDALRHLERTKGIKFLSPVSPYGFTATREWVQAVADACEVPTAMDRLDEIESRFRPEFLALRERLQGKVVCASGGPGRLLGLLHLLMDLGIEVNTAVLYWSSPRSQRDLEHLMAEHGMPINRLIVAPSFYEIEQLVRERKMDLWVGGFLEPMVVKKRGIPFVPTTVTSNKLTMLFEGAINLGNMMCMALDGYDFVPDLFRLKEYDRCES